MISVFRVQVKTVSESGELLRLFGSSDAPQVARTGMHFLRTLSVCSLFAVCAAALPARAEGEGAGGEAAPRAGLEDALPPDADLDGDEIYRRVLRNRFKAYTEASLLTSGDRGGNEHSSRLLMTWKSFRDGRADYIPESGILSKTMVRYTEPFDLRDSGYLIINNNERPSDQFVYLSSYRRVRRVSLRGETIFGTDFSFEDVVPREFEDSRYQRVHDELVGATPCYVVDLLPKPEAQSEYSKLRIYVEREHYVPLRSRYWDERGVEVKELLAEASTIREFEGVFIPMAATMKNLRIGTFTTVRIEEITPNPDLPETSFELRRLNRH